MSSIPITKRGAELLKEELHRLKHVERPSVINAISEARAQGDLSENAEYDAAKEKQGFIEGRIQELEGKLSAAQIIDPSALDVAGRIVFGATVDLEDLEDGTKLTYQIVGDDEADIALNKISISSPIARALIKEPKILLLDDCLSAVDNTTEAQLMNNFQNLFKDKTVINITHRLAHLDLYDKVLEMNENGFVIKK
jgi:transcription elongation factor GreA